jgi:DnaJ homolog subfamily C member 8
LTLYKAESELSDKDKREELDAVIKQARTVVLKALNLPLTISDKDERLQNLNPSFKTRHRLQSKELLIEEEVRRRKYALLELTLPVS